LGGLFEADKVGLKLFNEGGKVEKEFPHLEMKPIQPGGGKEGMREEKVEEISKKKKKRRGKSAPGIRIRSLRVKLNGI